MNNLYLHSQGCKSMKEDWQCSRIWQLETEMSRLLLFFSILFCLLALTFSYILSPIHFVFLWILIFLLLSAWISLTTSNSLVQWRGGSVKVLYSHHIKSGLFSLHIISLKLWTSSLYRQSLLWPENRSVNHTTTSPALPISLFSPWFYLSLCRLCLLNAGVPIVSACFVCMSLCVARSVSLFKLIRGSVKSSGKWTVC